MMQIFTRVLLAALLLSSVGALSARAEIGPYVGASIGQTRAELTLGQVDDAGFRVDDEDFAYKFLIGLDLLGPLAVEASYRDLGRVTDDNGLVNLSTESDAIDVFAVGKRPIGPVTLFGKLGLVSWDSQVNATADEGVGLPDIRIDDDGTDFAWGLGVSFKLQKIAFRAEFERFEVDTPDDLSMLSVGVVFRF